jgi:hypothetical protein
MELYASKVSTEMEADGDGINDTCGLSRDGAHLMKKTGA